MWIILRYINAKNKTKIFVQSYQVNVCPGQLYVNRAKWAKSAIFAIKFNQLCWYLPCRLPNIHCSLAQQCSIFSNKMRQVDPSVRPFSVDGLSHPAPILPVGFLFVEMKKKIYIHFNSFSEKSKAFSIW